MSDNNKSNNNLLDAVTMVSFIIGLLNLGENLTQGDKQDLITSFNNKASELLNEIHQHLEDQDKKLDMILQKLGEPK